MKTFSVLTTRNNSVILAWAVILACLTASSTPSIHAAIIAEDSFLTGGSNYLTGSDLAGQGPAATGFTGNWLSGSAGTTQPVGTGLTYSGVATSGGAVSLSSGNNRYGRLLSTPFTSSTTGTYYLSFLMDLSVVDGNYQAFELHDGGFDDATNRNFRLGNGGGANGFNDTNFGFRIAGGTIQDLGTANADTNFFVVRFDLSASPDSDDVTVFANPTDLAVESNNIGVTLTGQNIVFDRISVAMFTDTEVSFDELRLATEFIDVTTAPEPSAVALLLGGLAFVYFRRRR